jgi:hypothetical protein
MMGSGLIENDHSITFGLGMNYPAKLRGIEPERLNSFHSERMLFRPGGVNRRAYLCGVRSYASAQSLDFLARTKNPLIPIRKQVVSHPKFPNRN